MAYSIKNWEPLFHHEKQRQLWERNEGFTAVVAGRQSGKTVIARRKIVSWLPVQKPWGNPIYIYAMPTYSQAEKVAWQPLLDLINPKWIAKNGINVTNRSIRTIWNSTLYVIGTDKPERVEGLSIDGLVMDECSDQKPGIFETTFMPMFHHRNAWAWRIGVPKRHGVGAADFKEFYDRGLSSEFPNIRSFTWPSSDIIPEEKLEFARQTWDPLDFRELYEASWETVGGLIFHAFSEKDNVGEDAKYDPSKPIVVGSDFNVNPMCWILGHRYPDHFVVFDELHLRNANTVGTLNKLYSKYESHRGGWEFFGDATGQARKTAASSSDYHLIRNDARFLDKKVYYPKHNPPVLDRFAACNAMFCNANGTHRLFINPKCVKLIKDIKVRAFKEGTSIPDDSPDVGHITDALGYPIHMLYPVRSKKTSAPVVLVA